MKKFWMNLSIRYKILSYYLILLAILFFTLFAFNKTNIELQNMLTESMDEQYKVYTTMEKTNLDVKDVERYLLSNDRLAYESYKNRKLEIDNLIEELYFVDDSLESYFQVNAIYYAVKGYRERFDAAIERKRKGFDDYYIIYYEGVNIDKYLDGYFNSLLQENLKSESREVENIKQQAQKVREVTYNLSTVVTVLALALGLFIAHRIVTPIKKLSEQSKRISQGELDVKVSIDSYDEIGDLARVFNQMSNSIKNYVRKIKQQADIESKLHSEEKAVMQMEQLLQQARLEALQAKINPHFLFNTLNVISRTALFEQANETMSLIELLSNIFRYQLRSKGEQVSIQQEKQIILDYLKLQSVRFKERLKYEIDIDDDIDVHIPVLTFQPLVENAIIHGINPKIEGGTIVIRAYYDDIKVVIEVSDDGMGMDKEIVKSINLNSDIRIDRKKSIGLRNVKERFLLSFPNRSSFEVESKKDKGTIIRMIIVREELKNV